MATTGNYQIVNEIASRKTVLIDEIWLQRQIADFDRIFTRLYRASAQKTLPRIYDVEDYFLLDALLHSCKGRCATRFCARH